MSVAGKARHYPTSLELIFDSKKEESVLHTLIRDVVLKPGTASSRPIGSAFSVPGTIGSSNIFTEPIALHPKTFQIISDEADTLRIDKNFGSHASRIIVTGQGGAADNIEFIIGIDDGEGNTGKAAFAGQILNIEAVLTTPLTLIDGTDIATPGGASFLIRGGSNVTLVYDSVDDKWKFLHDALVQRLDELLDVTIVSPATGEHLEFTGTVWENKADLTLVSGGADLINLDDISFVEGHFLSQGTAAPHLNLIMSGDTTFRIGANTFGIVDFSDNTALGLKMLPNADIYMQSNQLFFDSPAATRSIQFDGTSALDYKVPAANFHRFFAGVSQRFGINDDKVIVDTVPLQLPELITPTPNPPANSGFIYGKVIGGTHAEPHWLDELGTETNLLAGGTSFIGFEADADLDMNTFDIFDIDILQFGLLSTLLLDTDVGITSTTTGDMQFNILNLQGFTFTHENTTFVTFDPNNEIVKLESPLGSKIQLQRINAPTAVGTLSKFSGNTQLDDPVEVNLSVGFVDKLSINSTGADFNTLDIQNLGNLLFDEAGKSVQADADDLIFNTPALDGFLWKVAAGTIVDMDDVAFRIGTMYYQLTSIVDPGASGFVNIGRLFLDSADSHKLKIRRNGVAIDLEGGSQTPILQDVDYDGFDILDLSNIEFRDTTGAPAASARAIHADTFGIQHLVPATQTHEFFVAGNLIGFFTETAGRAFDIGPNDIRFDSSTRFIDFDSADNGVRIEHPTTEQFNLTFGGALEYDFTNLEFDLHANNLSRVTTILFNILGNELRGNSGGLELVCQAADDFEFFRGTSLLAQLDENELDLNSAVVGIDLELDLNNGFIRWNSTNNGTPSIETASSSILFKTGTINDVECQFASDVLLLVTPDGQTGSGNAFVSLQKTTISLEAVFEAARIHPTAGDAGGRYARFQGVAKNSTPVSVVYGDFELFVETNTAGSEDGEIALVVRVNGGFTDLITGDAPTSGTIPRLGFRGAAPVAITTWSATGAGAPDRTVTTTSTLPEVAESLVTLINDLEDMGILG